MTRKTKKILSLFAFIALVCLCLWVSFGGIFALNFTFALVCFLLIVAVVFYLQKRKIDSLIQNATKEELEALADAYKSKQERLEEEEEEEEFFNTLESQNNPNALKSAESKDFNVAQDKSPQIPQIQKRKFWHNFSAVNVKTGAKMFFLPLRLFAYGFLVIGILILIKQQSFDILAFFSGLIVANLLTLAMLLFARTT